MADSVARVLLAEDSPTVRHHLTGLINEIPGLCVIGEARDGREVVDMAETLRPDVISMDIRMPYMDGLEATRQIMARCPTPIVVVSSLLDDDIDLSFRALQAGALAVVPKPPSRQAPTFADHQRHLGNTLLAMAAVRVIRRWDRVSMPLNGARLETTRPLGSARAAARLEVVVVGASAGGPSALSVLLGSLNASFPLPVLITQHIPEEFIAGLTRWLNKVSPLTVSVAEHHRPLKPGNVYLAPGHAHLALARQGTQLVAQLIPEQGPHRYRPSVDVLFQSAAAVCGSAAVGVVLTGMGDDGATGLLAIRQAGGLTFAQDQASCTVFGMPSAAIERGAVDQTLPLDQMAETLLRLLD